MTDGTTTCKHHRITAILLVITLMAAVLLPCHNVAYAQIGWSAKNEAMSTGVSTEDPEQHVDELTDEITSVCTSVTSWAIGLAVAMFILRIGLTAIDRMLLPRQGTKDAFHLSQIPIIGAYPDPDEITEMTDNEKLAMSLSGKKGGRPRRWTWQVIWVNFAKQLAVCAGAWILVRVLLGIVGSILALSI